jgi:hypothetical protein
MRTTDIQHAAVKRCLRGRARIHGAGTRGAILLEVVLSSGILFAGMTIIGIQVVNGLQIARNVESTLQATLLVDTLLAELDAGAIMPGATDDRIEGDFGIRAPGYAWRILIEPADVDDLLVLAVQISHDPDDEARQQQNADRRIDFNEEQILREVHRLYPIPAEINMERDFGVTSEDIQAVFGGGGGPGQDGGLDPGGDFAALAAQLGVDLSSFDFLFDPSGFDPRQLAQLPEDEFMALMSFIEALLQQGGGALTELSGRRSDRGRGQGQPSDPGDSEGADDGTDELPRPGRRQGNRQR